VGVLNLAAVWVGRDELLDELYARLMDAAGPRVVALVGQGGIGKTSLAAKLVERCGVSFGQEAVLPKCPFDGVFCLKVGEGMGFDEVAGRLLGALDGSADLVKVEDKLAAIWKGLRQEKWLVVLDNLEDLLCPAGDARSGRTIDPDLGRLLNGLVYEPHRSRVVLTSREKLRDLADVRSFGGEPDRGLVWVESVEGLATEAGMDLLREFGLRDSEDDLRWVVERVGGHVFVLRQLASLAQGKPGYLRKHPLLVTREAGPILRAQLGRLEAGALELLKRMCVLRVGIDVRGLTFLRLFTDLELFTNLNVLAEAEAFDDILSNRFVLAATIEEPAELTDEEIAETQTLINQLMGCSLIQNRYDEQICEDFYDLHRLVVEFLQAEFETELPELIQRVYAFYCTGKTVENPKTLEDLRPLLEAQHFAFQLGSYDEAESLIYQLEKYLEPWGHWTLLQGLYQQILNRIPENSQPYILQRLGSRERDWGNWDQAEKYYQAGLELAEKHQDRSLIAGLTGNLGDIEHSCGNWDAAERLYRQSLQLREELGDRSGMASSWCQLGDIERKRGNWDAAERLYRQCLQVEEELGDRSGMASSYNVLGHIHLSRGDWDEAQQSYEKSLEILQQLGDRSYVHNLWSNLGTIELNRGNWDAAELLYRQSLQLREELGDRSGMASSWCQLGDIEHNCGNWDAAERLFRQSLQLREELGDRLGIAETTYDIGTNDLESGNLEAAEHHLTDALKRFEELGDRPYMAEVHYRLMQLEHKRHNPTAAHTHYTTAHTLYTQLGAAKDLEKIEQEWNALQ
jgi:tetratricopeptide (TPR) repeat protein